MKKKMIIAGAIIVVCVICLVVSKFIMDGKKNDTSKTDSSTSKANNIVENANQGKLIGTHEYSFEATDQEVNKFAKKIQKMILAKKWSSVANEVNYPVLVASKLIKTKKEFCNYHFDKVLASSFYQALKKEKCDSLFNNYQGAMLADGQVWINEVANGSGKKVLKIIAINK